MVAVGLLAGGALGSAVRWWAGTGAPAAAPPAVAIAPFRPVERPHVVLIVGCTVRLDQVTPYGGHPQATPHLQQLADRGVRFADAIAAAPWTRAASTALLTGHHPIDVGMIEPGPGANRRRLADEVDTLAEHFQRAGYTTVGTTANPNLNEVFGFHQGFDHYLEVTERWGAVGMVKVPGDEVVAGLVNTLDTLPRDAGPLYLQAMLIDAHEPRQAGPEALAALGDDGVPPRVAEYRVNLRRFDAAVGLLVDELAARGIDDPLLVVVSDHGEGLMYPFHHGRGHGSFTYGSAVRMPWILTGPGVAPGHVVQGVASQVDVLPTLLDLAGLPSAEGPGTSWADAVRGGADRTTRDVAWVDTWFQSASRSAAYQAEVACHHDAVDRGSEEHRRLRPATACYDRRTDPWADEPLEPGDRELIERLMAWRADGRAAYDAWEHTADVSYGAALREQLEALGYQQRDRPDDRP